MCAVHSEESRTRDLGAEGCCGLSQLDHSVTSSDVMWPSSARIEVKGRKKKQGNELKRRTSKADAFRAETMRGDIAISMEVGS